MVLLLLAAGAGDGFTAAFESDLAVALLDGLRLYGGLFAGAGRFCVGVVVVFFEVGVAGGVDVVATPRLRDANLAGVAERVSDKLGEDLMQHLAALDDKAIMCG